MSVSTSLTNSLRSLVCNDAAPLVCECAASTIAALAANLLTAALPFVCAALGTGNATLPFGPLTFELTTGFGLDLDLNLLPLGRTVACPPVDDSGAFTGADVAFDWLTLRMPGCGEGEAPDPPAGTPVRAGTGDGLPKPACCGEPALTTFTLTPPGTSQERSISSRSLARSFFDSFPPFLPF